MDHRCVLIAGLPASGKTTFAEHLGRELRLPIISKDRIKELMYNTIGFRSRGEKAVLGRASSEILYYYAESLMQAGLPFILENNFENVSKPQLKTLLEAYRYQSMTVRFGGDIRVLYERYIAREASGGRHKGHTTSNEYPAREDETRLVAPLSFDAFVEGVTQRGIGDFTVGGEELYVDTTHFEQVRYTDIVQDVQRFLGCGPLL